MHVQNKDITVTFSGCSPEFLISNITNFLAVSRNSLSTECVVHEIYSAFHKLQFLSHSSSLEIGLNYNEERSISTKLNVYSRVVDGVKEIML
jgi:hypothetical protein